MPFPLGEVLGCNGGMKRSSEAAETPKTDEGQRKPLSKGANWAINIGLLVAAVALYLVVAEFVLRASEDTDETSSRPYANVLQKSEDPLLLYELRPGGGQVVNQLGYIGPEVKPTKPTSALRVVGIGDSITMYGTYEGYNYLTQLGKRWRVEGKNVQVLNFAVGGYDTAQELRTLETKGLAYQPDVVVLGYCLNDGFAELFVFNQLTGKIALGDKERTEVETVIAMNSDGEGQGLAIVDFFSRKVRAASADLTREVFEATVFESKVWAESMAGLKRLGELSKTHGFRAVVVIFPFLVDFESYLFGTLHSRVAAAAAGAGVEVVDLREAYSSVGYRSLRNNNDGEMSEDYVHPNEQGHRIAVEALMERLKSTVSPVRAPAAGGAP